LSFALGGVFGLEIHSLTLTDATLTEDDLISLFNSLPHRYIILLEDVDSAGPTKRDRKSRAGNNSGGAGGADDAESEPPASPGSPVFPRTSLNKQITLSGLLNALDGVASGECRILIMTTNHPERLDHALIRPGRVDMIINYRLATQQQIKDLFLQVYEPDSEEIPCSPQRSACSYRWTTKMPAHRPVECSQAFCLTLRATLHPADLYLVGPILVDPLVGAALAQKSDSVVSLTIAIRPPAIPRPTSST
jgi:hypothetical protein